MDTARNDLDNPVIVGIAAESRVQMMHDSIEWTTRRRVEGVTLIG
jgi:hypothetical protein